MKGILLDTHVWVWLMEGHDNLAPQYQAIINQAAQDSEVGIAAISLWEVGMLAARGRLKLVKPLLSWIQDALALPGITLKPLSPEIAADSVQLPDGFHGDPADCLLVATARIHGLTLVTHDQKIIDYAQKEYVAVLAVNYSHSE